MAVDGVAKETSSEWRWGEGRLSWGIQEKVREARECSGRAACPARAGGGSVGKNEQVARTWSNAGEGYRGPACPARMR